MSLDDHIETAFFGFGGTTKTIPELLIEIGISAEYMDKAIFEFNELREKKEHDKTYYYEGKMLLEKINQYKRRLNNRIDKLIIAHNREARDYSKRLLKRHSDEYIKPNDIDVKKTSPSPVKTYDDEEINEDDEIKI